MRMNITSSCILHRMLHQKKLWFLQPILQIKNHKCESHVNDKFGPGCLPSSVKTQATTNRGLSVQLCEADTSYTSQDLEF